MGHKRLDHVYSPVQIIRAAPAGRPSLENHLMQLAEPGKFKHILYCFCTARNYFYASKAKGFRKQSKARFRRHRVDFAYWLYYIRQMATALQNFVEDAPLERARAIARGLPARLVRDLVADPAVTIADVARIVGPRSEEHKSELQSLMRISYAVFCLKKKK